MSLFPPTANAAENPIETIVPPRERDLGGQRIQRILPFRERRTVGPFIFLDQFGPLEILHERALEVPPHPHIGLATVTYLFSGALRHRDSLGSVQLIRPSEVNWMTAGRGIVHSERTSDAGNPLGTTLRGVQTWVALPRADEEREPQFAHHGAAELPEMAADGVWLKLILGDLLGQRSPVVTCGEPFYAECRLEPGARFAFPAHAVEESSACVVAGELLVNGERFTPGTLVVFNPRAEILLSADVPTRLMLLGGARLDGPRHIWWNFVSSSLERIEAAKADWQAARFAPVPGEVEFVSLPSWPPAPSPAR